MSTKILSSDIQLRASERMTDASDGGGEMSPVVITDNKINQVFDPISTADRDAGRVSLRQVYALVNTTTDDTFYGSNAIVDTPPTDPNVEVLLFDPGIVGASRAQAQTYIESYIAIGPRSRMQPVGKQSAGQGMVLAYQPLNKPLPEIGDVYILSVETGATAGTTQAFKVVNLEASTETFYYDDGQNIAEFVCTQLLITISQPLSFDFPGADPKPTQPGDSWIRRTVPSNNANYFGVAKLTASASIGALEFNVNSIQKQLIPAVTSEVVVANAIIGYSTIDVNAGSHTVSVSNASHTIITNVTIGSVGINYVKTLRPAPAPGSLTVAYRSAGIWYNLNDDGNGSITGDSTAYGSGTINYTTGSCVVTLGTTPDIGSIILWQYGSPVHYETNTTASTSLPRMYVNLGTEGAPEEIEPGSLTVGYTKNSVYTTVTSNTDGVISNADVTGYVNQRIGYVVLDWLVIPDALTNLVINYQHATHFAQTFHEAAWNNSTGEITFNLGQTNITPRTVNLSWRSKARYGAGVYHIPTNPCG
jgi:hypothetical protein